MWEQWGKKIHSNRGLASLSPFDEDLIEAGRVSRQRKWFSFFAFRQSPITHSYRYTVQVTGDRTTCKMGFNGACGTSVFVLVTLVRHKMRKNVHIFSFRLKAQPPWLTSCWGKDLPSLYGRLVRPVTSGQAYLRNYSCIATGREVV